MRGVALALALALLGAAPVVAASDASAPAVPAPSSACRHPEPVKFLSHGDPYKGFSKVVCTVDYWVCNKAYTRRSDPVENKRGACDAFTASVKGEVGASACCDQ